MAKIRAFMANGGGGQFTSVTQNRAIPIAKNGTWSIDSNVGVGPYKCVIGVYAYVPDNFTTHITVGNDTDGYKAPDLVIPSPTNATGEVGVWFDVPANSYFKADSYASWTVIGVFLN